MGDSKSPPKEKSNTASSPYQNVNDFISNVARFKIIERTTGLCAFTHKAGIHAKAILANPSPYEIIDPAIFGLTRYISINSRITGWNAIRARCEQLGLNMTDDEVKEVTAKIKKMADIRPLAIDDTDSILHSYHIELQKRQEQQV
ncbi:hypothetical protein V8C34DRAFT_304183 [Trichoderma compactum]